jgi:hypothetical protein
MPTIVCAICSAFLAYKERSQWVWFTGLTVLAGVGGLWTLGVVHAQTAFIRMVRVREGRTPSGLRHDELRSGQTLTSTRGGSSSGKLASAASIAAALAWSTA